MKDPDHRVSDEELVTKFLQGEQDAFRELVERYQTLLVNYTFRFTGSRESAEEIIQETFMAVFQNLSKFKLDLSFRAWIYAIATNRAINSRRRRTTVCDDGKLENVADREGSPFQRASEQERANAVQKALALLPERQRAVFILRFYQRLSYEEIAVAVGCPIGTVKSRMCYALKKMRGILWTHRDE